MDTRELDRLALATWSAISEPADHKVGALISHLGPQRALDWAQSDFAQPAESEALSGTNWRTVHQRIAPRLTVFNLEAELTAMTRLGAQLIVRGDPTWPASFNKLGDGAPFALWVQGNLPVDFVGMAVVGARASSSYGETVAAELSMQAAANAVTVVSGGAYGIDAAAHRGALHCAREGTCPTVAVLCGGLTSRYPAGNEKLFQRILGSGGALMCEMPPSFRPARWRFLERNRLIAALSELVVVVEASARSGALATANRAADLGVDVCAVPGPINSPLARGTNELIAQGAGVVTDPSTPLALMGIQHDESQQSGPQRAPSTARGSRAEVQAARSGSLGGTARPGRPGRPKAVRRADNVSAKAQALLARLDPLERRVWDALPVKGSADAGQVAAHAGLAQRETQAALLTLQACGLTQALLDGTHARAAA